MTITLDLPADLEVPLRNAARIRGKDVAAFLLDSVRQNLRTDVLPESEAALLRIINAPVAPAARTKRDALLARQSNEALSESELGELSDLIDEVEIANAERWRCIAALAELRGTSLASLARELEIPLS